MAQRPYCRSSCRQCWASPHWNLAWCCTGRNRHGDHVTLTVVTITTFLLSRLSLDATFAYLSIVFAIRMGGLALAVMPALNQLPPKWYSHGSAMAKTLQQTSAAIGAAILVTVVATTAQNYNFSPGISPGQAGLEAQLSGYTWAFLVSTALAFVAFLLAWFLHPRKKEQEIVAWIHRRRPGQAPDDARGKDLDVELPLARHRI